MVDTQPRLCCPQIGSGSRGQRDEKAAVDVKCRTSKGGRGGGRTSVSGFGVKPKVNPEAGLRLVPNGLRCGLSPVGSAEPPKGSEQGDKFTVGRSPSSFCEQLAGAWGAGSRGTQGFQGLTQPEVGVTAGKMALR